MNVNTDSGCVTPGLDELHYKCYVQEQQRKATARERVVILSFSDWQAHERIKRLHSRNQAQF